MRHYFPTLVTSLQYISLEICANCINASRPELFGSKHEFESPGSNGTLFKQMTKFAIHTLDLDTAQNHSRFGTFTPRDVGRD